MSVFALSSTLRTAKTDSWAELLACLDSCPTLGAKLFALQANGVVLMQVA